LILTNDLYRQFSKTSEYLAKACRSLGVKAWVRDTSDIRFLKTVLEEDTRNSFDGTAEVFRKKYHQFVEREQVETVMGLDFHWFLDDKMFLDQPAIKNIYSIWFDDFRSWCLGTYNNFFLSEGKSFQDVIRHKKVCHCFYGPQMAEEGKMMGFDRQKLSWLAAPSEYIETDFSCEITNKAAFIGNPGFRGAPHPEIVKRMQEGADLDELRKLSQHHVLAGPPPEMQQWIKAEPSVFELIGAALEKKRKEPHQSALSILHQVSASFTRAFEYLNNQGVIIDAALIVRLALSYDRPAMISRLYKKGLLDVYSSPEEWEQYGIKALPFVNLKELPITYRKYSLHVNAANCLRDATANEKLFEIAACGRVSINLDSPDVRSVYSSDEVSFVNSLAELEETAQKLLGHSDEALVIGERARSRTAREHLWEHRVKAILNLK
jgi:hypothetical protein